jgi:hypothetical protein
MGGHTGEPKSTTESTSASSRSSAEMAALADSTLRPRTVTLYLARLTEGTVLVRSGPLGLRQRVHDLREGERPEVIEPCYSPNNTLRPLPVCADGGAERWDSNVNSHVDMVQDSNRLDRSTVFLCRDSSVTPKVTTTHAVNSSHRLPLHMVRACLASTGPHQRHRQCA